jgi:hypothetical protein
VDAPAGSGVAPGVRLFDAVTYRNLGNHAGPLPEVARGDAADGGEDTTGFDLTVGDGHASWVVYRADLFASLYAPGDLARQG